MKNGTQFVGILVGAAGVVVGLKGAFEWGSVPIVLLGVAGFAAGLALIFRGHYEGR